MADTKISALPASTTPLAGTEVLPIVQSSATKQVSVANLTAGRAISATQLTLTTGNLIVASGQGIDFSATSGTGTSELLADYEEGTWTPTINREGAVSGVTYTVQSGTYTKIGRVVYFSAAVAYSAISGAGSASNLINGLPFSAGITQSNGNCSFTISSGFPTTAVVAGMPYESGIYLRRPANVLAGTNVTENWSASGAMTFAGFYFV